MPAPSPRRLPLVLALAGAPALALALAAPPATAQPAPPADPVQARIDRAMAYYEAADLARALDELAAAYAESPRPDLLFAMGRIHVERGECAEAIAAYRRFLASKPGPNSTQIATDAIAECQKVLAAAGERLPVDPGTGAAGLPAGHDRTAATAAPPAVPTRTRPWYTDALGDALVGVGLAGGVTAGALYLSARDDLDRAAEGGPGGVTLAEHDRLVARADRKQLWAGIAGGVGAALVVGGVIRFVTGDRTETVTVAPAAGGAGASVTVGWRF